MEASPVYEASDLETLIQRRCGVVDCAIYIN